MASPAIICAKPNCGFGMPIIQTVQSFFQSTKRAGSRHAFEASPGGKKKPLLAEQSKYVVIQTAQSFLLSYWK